MCFVLDINAFHCIFDRSSAKHADFAPLCAWLYNNPHTSLVYGGTHYQRELDKLNKYVVYLAELRRGRKLSIVDKDHVDIEEARIKKIIPQQYFDDAHLVAIVCASGCLIIASCDRRADQFIKQKRLYKRMHKRPSIYRSSKHSNLLCNKKIVHLRNVT